MTTLDSTLPLANDFQETAYSKEPLGPSSRSICRVINQNSCGSGTIVGFRGDKTLVLTNAHVAGTTIGRVVKCELPFLNKLRVDAKVILAGYSDKVMMDWAILEIDEKLSLPATKLSINAPSGDHYTGGYPRCEGPWFQRLVTHEITHSGTVWKWSPNSIGGQSGSGVHSFKDNLQFGLLTWSWGGYGAGQTARSIWFQYQQRAVVGFIRPPDLIELGDNRAPDLESGFFMPTAAEEVRGITELPIWAHLDDVTPPPTGDLAKAVIDFATEQAKSLQSLLKLAQTGGGSGTGTKPVDPEDDMRFGL